MTQVHVSNNLDRKIITVNEETATPKDALQAAGYSFGNNATISLDGAVLDTKQMNTPLAKLGIRPDSECFLAAVVKATNA